MEKTQKYKFSMIVTNDNFLVRDHQLFQVGAVPGVTYLDAIYRFLMGKGYLPENIELKKVLFKEPVVTSDEFDKKVTVSLTKNKEYWEIAARSKKMKGELEIENEWADNFQGEFHISGEAVNKTIDIEMLKNQADSIADMETSYASMRNAGLCHYEFMKLLGDVYIHRRYLLAELHLGELAKEYLPQFFIHPAYLDGALSVLGVLIAQKKDLDTSGENPIIPMYIESFRAFQRIGDKAYIYVDLDNIIASDKHDIMYYNVELYNDKGEIAAAYNKFGAKRVRNKAIKRLETIEDTVEQRKNTEFIIANSISEQKGLHDTIRELIASVTDRTVEQVNPIEDFYTQGFDSSDLLKIVTALENRYDRELYPTLLFEYTNISMLAQYLTEELDLDEIVPNIKNVCSDDSNQQPDHGLLTDKAGITNILIEMVSKTANISADKIKTDEDFYTLGLDSGALLTLVSELEARLNRELYPTLLFEYANIDALADYLLEEYQDMSIGSSLEVKKSTNEQRKGQSILPEKGVDKSYYFGTTWVKKPVESVSNHEVNRIQEILLICDITRSPVKNTISQLYPDARIQVILLGEEGFSGIADGHNVDISDDSHIKKCLGEMDKIDMIFFLGGINTIKFSEDDMLSLKKAQQYGELTFFRLVKGLIDTGLIKTLKYIKVLTNGIYRIKDEDINPYGAALVGLVKVFIKEYPQIKTACIDINMLCDSGRMLKTAVLDGIKALNMEESQSRGEEIALRDGVRFVNSIQPLSFTCTDTSTLRKGGTYLILGGAGGIGLVLSKYLAEKVNACLVLIGRKKLNHNQKSKIKEIEERGGQVLYIQADACDIQSMKRAYLMAKERFTEINGVFHSAFVLKDSTYYQMDERTLDSVLDPKVKGSLILNQVLKDENLDFMMFFSAAQSFIGSIGQGNYTAACMFQDSYAQYLNQIKPYPVKTINWGFWGEVGAVATDDYKKKLSETGILSIQEKEGIEAIEHVLGGSLSRVIVMKLKENLIDKIGIDTNQKMVVLPAMDNSKVKGIVDDLRCSADKDMAMVESGKTEFIELEKFGKNLLLYAMKRMGMSGNITYEKNKLKEELHIITEYNRLYEAVLKILRDAGYILVKGKNVKIAENIEVLSKQKLQEMKNNLENDYPGMKAHTELLWRCINSYPKVLAGQQNHMSVLFPKGSTELVENIYKGSPAADYYNEVVAEAVYLYVTARLNNHPDTKIHILEVGAGTGGTTCFVVDRLRDYQANIIYHYTDIEMKFTLKNDIGFIQKYPFVKFAPLNIEKNTMVQGFSQGSIDIVLASNVLHATKNIRQSVLACHNLLKTNGLIIVNELTRFQEFVTLTFGLTGGWWLYEDSENRMDNAPLVSPEGWGKLLWDCGFTNTEFIGLPGEKKAESGQHVIIGESDGCIREEKQGIKNHLAEEKRIFDRKKSLSKYRSDIILAGGGIEILDVCNRKTPPEFECYWEKVKKGKEASIQKVDIVKDYLELSTGAGHKIVHLLAETKTGNKMEAVISGQGRTVVLLCAFGYTAPQWIYQFREITDKYKLVVVHTPGVGLSDPGYDLTFHKIAKLVRELLDTLDIKESVHIIGSSWGGLVAQTFSVDYREKTASLTLTGSFCQYKEETSEMTLNEKSRIDFDTDENRMYYDFFNQTQCRKDTKGYEDFFANGFSTLDILEKINVPSLIITGEKDAVIGVGEAELIRTKISGAEYLEIKGAGHIPNLTHHEIFNKCILEFMEKVDKNIG